MPPKPTQVLPKSSTGLFRWWVMILLMIGTAQAESSDPQFTQVVGKVFGILSRGHLVSGQEEYGRLTVWVDAHLATVEETGGREPEIVKTKVTKLMPNATGVVLRFMGPFDPSSTARVYMTRIDKSSRTFDVLIPIRSGRAIFISTEYGEHFPAELQLEILALERLFTEAEENKWRVRWVNQGCGPFPRLIGWSLSRLSIPPWSPV